MQATFIVKDTSVYWDHTLGRTRPFCRVCVLRNIDTGLLLAFDSSRLDLQSTQNNCQYVVGIKAILLGTFGGPGRSKSRFGRGDPQSPSLSQASGPKL